MAIGPASGTIIGSRDDLSCRDHFDGQQPRLFRSYKIAGSVPDARDAMAAALRQQGWTQSSPPYFSFTKAVGGVDVVISMTTVDAVVFLEAAVPGIDYC